MKKILFALVMTALAACASHSKNNGTASVTKAASTSTDEAEETECTYKYQMHPGVNVETSVAEAQQKGAITVNYSLSASGSFVSHMFAKVVREGEKSVVLYGVVVMDRICPLSFELPSEGMRK